MGALQCSQGGVAGATCPALWHFPELSANTKANVSAALQAQKLVPLKWEVRVAGCNSSFNGSGRKHLEAGPLVAP